MTLVSPWSFHSGNFIDLCKSLADKDEVLAAIVEKFGYPPLWSRPANFSTLIHIILEQQVSLASARSAFERLKDRLGDITPENLLQLSDLEMRACYFSRQKTIYARELASAVIERRVVLHELGQLPDEEIRQSLKQVKGIGDWTVDIYLLFALQRSDLFPTGDLAMMKAIKEVKQLRRDTSREDIMLIAEPWRPYRSIATMLLWHYYIMTKGIAVPG